MDESKSKEELYKYHKEQYKKYLWLELASCCVTFTFPFAIIPLFYFYFKAKEHHEAYKALEKELAESNCLE